MNNYFYVDVDEEITSVIGKLRKNPSDEAFLVVPKRAMISQSLVNLKLLEKEAKKLKKKLIFVSPDANTRKIAEKAGLSVKKYLTKPKDEASKEPTLPGKRTQPLAAWEEAAANEELKRVIKKEELKPRSTKIKAQVFSSAPQIIPPPTPATPSAPTNTALPRATILPPRPTRPGGSKVVDLKSLAAQRANKPPEPVKIENAPVEKQTELVEEPELKDLLAGSEVEILEPENAPVALPAQELTPEPKPSSKAKIAKINPFRIKKLGQSAPPATLPSPPAAVTPPPLPSPPPVPIPESPTLTAGEEFKKVPALTVASPAPPLEVSDESLKRLERETANLTLREKEKLRDLWMEQKKVVRGKTFHEGTMDLKPTADNEISKQEVVEEDRGIFQTTHRRVVGSGKIIDLRSRTPLINFPKLSQEKNFKKKGKEIILPLFNVRLFIFFIIGITAALMIIIGIIMPEATVAIKPKQSSDNLNLKVMVSGEVSQIDAGQRIIPGKPVHFKVSEQETVNTTNTKQIQENSQGQVTIQNQASEPLSLKANAMLTDSSGKKFYLTAPVTVPAAKQDNSNSNANANANTNAPVAVASTPGNASAGVSAEGVGKDYNLKEGASLTIPGLKGSDFESSVTVAVKKDIAGGESRTAKTVSQEDLDNAKQELIDKAKQESFSQLSNNLDAEAVKQVKPENLYLEDVSFSADRSAGDEADSFNASASVTFFTLAFPQQDLQSLAKTIVESDSEEKNGTIKINSYEISDAKPLENKMEISTNLDYQVKSQVDAGEIQKFLIAKKSKEAEDYLKGRTDIDQYTLSLWPGFIGHLPILEKRIKVLVE